MSRKIITILSIVLIASFALAACGTPAPTEEPAQPAATKAPEQPAATEAPSR